MTDFNALLNGVAPQIKPVSDPDRGASFGSLAESYRVDDPNTRMKILAKNRGISPDRYRQIDGEIVYQGDDGNWYKSEPDGFMQGAKQFGASLAGHADTLGGGGVGAYLGTVLGGPPGGVVGAALGSAAGAATRKLHGYFGYDEPQTAAGNFRAIDNEAGLGLLGEGVGQLVGKAVTRKAVRDIDSYDQAAVGLLSDKAARAGITLTPAELTNLRSLINRQSLLRDLPESADVMEDFLRMRNKQIQRGIYSYLDTLSSETTPHLAYKQGIEAAQGARGNLVSQREAAAKPFYDAAKSQPADMAGVVSTIDEMLPDFAGTSIGAKLAKVRGALDGKETAGAVHNVKMELDDMIGAAQRKGKNAQVSQLQKVKQQLLSTLEEQAPAYGAGREAYSALSGPINALDKSLVGDVIKQADKAAPDLGRILFGRNSSPLAVKQARAAIAGYDPKAWNAVVRAHIQTTLEDIATSSVDEAGNLGGMFRKKLIGTTTKERMVRNAMTDQQYRALQDLSDVLQATGRAAKGQSMTAQRQVMIEDMKREAGSSVANLAAPHKIPAKVNQWIQDVRLGKYSEKLAQIMTDPQGMQKLREQVKLLKQLSPREEAFYNTLGTTLALITGNQE